jgi:ubiquinone/menaquinone biosynthesis methyltransferase
VPPVREDTLSNLIAEVDARSKDQAEHAVAVRSMFDRISPTYDLLNRLLSVGIDKAWRRRALDRLAALMPAGPVLDTCAGTLDLAQVIEQRFPDRSVIATDFAREMLVRGRSKVNRVPLAVGDSMRLPVQDAVLAGMTCSFGIRNLSDPAQGIAEAYRALKPGGVFVVLEFFRPTTLFMRLFHGVYARVVLPSVGFLVSRDREAYGYLARSMQGFFSLEEFTALGKKAGFRTVTGENLSFGIASLVCMVK